MMLYYPPGFCSPNGPKSCANLSDTEKCSDCPCRAMDYRYTTDGCSGSFMCLLRWIWWVRWQVGLSDVEVPPWEVDCERHDQAYYIGGSRQSRLEADTTLMQAVARHGYPRLARWIFVGVCVGGMPRLPLPWRWGYGKKWPRGYQ